jgi:hypothetical protein
MSFYALKDHMDEKAWKDFEGVEPPATHFDGPTQAEIEEAARAAVLKTAAAPSPVRGRAICEEALRTINVERQDQYGNPEDTFKQIGHLWTAYLSRGGHMTMITPPMVADMMCLLKIARENGGRGKRDNAVDLIGYAALGARMRGYDV